MSLKLASYSEVIRSTKESDIVEMQNRIQTFQQNASQQLQDRGAELMQPIYDKIQIAIDIVGKREGYSYILDASKGGTVIDQKVIFQCSLKANAHQIILAHNHPSGNLNPSEADKSITRKIKGGAELLNITLLDHLMISPDKCFYSFADEGLL